MNQIKCGDCNIYVLNPNLLKINHHRRFIQDFLEHRYFECTMNFNEIILFLNISELCKFRENGFINSYYI